MSIAIFAAYGALAAWETVVPARRLPQIRGWKLRGLAALAVYFLLSSYLPLVWGGWLAQFHLVNLTGLGTWAGAAVGLLVYEAGAYLWHRSMHASNLLWRTFHQMHHSAERLDTWSAFWFSPLDMVGWTALASLCLTVVVGLTAQATTLVLLAATLLSMFQHANLRTPRWLGYIVQRPEAHSMHHGRGMHAGNYADLPLFDLPFRHLAQSGELRPGNRVLRRRIEPRRRHAAFPRRDAAAGEAGVKRTRTCHEPNVRIAGTSSTRTPCAGLATAASSARSICSSVTSPRRRALSRAPGTQAASQ